MSREVRQFSTIQRLAKARREPLEQVREWMRTEYQTQTKALDYKDLHGIDGTVSGIQREKVVRLKTIADGITGLLLELDEFCEPGI